ncbi:hypothetical protein [Geodermatophilus sp. TF02-6]|uniref:hypothetical protein n=1 Tax=Geodermatophilus sp. TF02-6 TaxID=2250575 RepID=UPI00131411EC|nr:hypothetical protein [Geodermatophilus sp. TF02-6]
MRAEHPAVTRNAVFDGGVVNASTTTADGLSPTLVYTVEGEQLVILQARYHY